MTRLQLCTGLLRRGGGVLLVRCRYDGEPAPLWVLPGGRLEPGETVEQALVREFVEETGLRIEPGPLAYVSESVDVARDLHVCNITFFVTETDDSALPSSNDPRVTDIRFVPPADVPALLEADVLRIPVEAALAGGATPAYFAFRADRVAVPFFGRTAASAVED